VLSKTYCGVQENTRQLLWPKRSTAKAQKAFAAPFLG